MVFDPDIFRVAKLLIDQHGDDAAICLWLPKYLFAAEIRWISDTVRHAPCHR